MSEVWMWAVWGTVILVTGGLIEGLALRHPERQWTLSHCIAWLGANFPLSIGIFGMLMGGAAVHFFWHFCPFGDVGAG